MYILRVLANEEGDFLIGKFDPIELKCILWSFENLEDYKTIFDDEKPYFYVNKII